MRKSQGITHEICRWEDGKFIVPEESKLWYATLWKWKWLFPVDIEKHKIAFVKEYEETHGKITHWKDAEANMRPIIDGRNQADLAYYASKKEQEEKQNAAA